MHFGISEGKRGLKHGSHLWLGMDIFWNCPMTLNMKALLIISKDVYVPEKGPF